MADAKDQKPEAGHSFTHTSSKGVTRKFKTLLAKMVIPGVNDGKPMTSLEVSNSDEAKKYLVENKTEGSVIEEVFEQAAPAGNQE